MVSIHDRTLYESALRKAGVSHQQARRLRIQFFKHFEGCESALASVEALARKQLSDSVLFHSLELKQRIDSSVDGASRLIFEQARGLLLESVILRVDTGRTALCISSQIGCAAGCVFCATGQMRQAVNLSPSEILDQVIQAGEILRIENRRIRNIVFMGMGEPFHNEDAVSLSVDRLLDSQTFNHSANRILVSTVGAPDAMIRFATRFPDVNMALSLHAADTKTRESIIPVARRIQLPALREAVAEVEELRGGRPMMIEWVLLDGINDTDEHLEALASWLKGLSVHINLIPFNAPAEGGNLRPTPPQRRDSFAASLKDRGFTCTLRYSLGSDIAAACGQLVTSTNRFVLDSERS